MEEENKHEIYFAIQHQYARGPDHGLRYTVALGRREAIQFAGVWSETPNARHTTPCTTPVRTALLRNIECVWALW